MSVISGIVPLLKSQTALICAFKHNSKCLGSQVMSEESDHEKLLRLREEHVLLQQKSNEQEDVIRRMNTKLAVIEGNLKTKQKLEMGAGGASSAAAASPVRGPPGQPRSRENEDLISELYRVNSELQKKNLRLQNKHQALIQVITKYKKDLERMRKIMSLRQTSKTPGRQGEYLSDLASRPRSLSPPTGTSSLEDLSAKKLATLVGKLRVRLIKYEEQLAVVKDENMRLCTLKMDHYGTQPAEQRDLAATQVAGRKRVSPESAEIEKLERELRDTRGRLQLLQTRYEHLEAKSQAQCQIQRTSIDQLDDYNIRLRDLRRDLQEAQHDREDALLHLSRIPDLEEKVRELKHTNEQLEQQMTKLCESPFVAEAFERQERMAQLHHLERQDRAQKLKIEHLQQAAQSSHVDLQARQRTITQLREDKEQLLRELEGLQIKHRQSEADTQLLQDKMRLYIGDDDIHLQELETALTLVRRRSEARNQVVDIDFLEHTEEGGDINNLAALRRKVQDLQVVAMNASQQLDRCERMLKAQTAINKDLHLEIEQLTRRNHMDRKDLQEKLENFEALALKRLQRLHYLEAQIRQYRYAMSRPTEAQRHLHTPLLSTPVMRLHDNAEGLLIEELATGDFGPEDNLLEVWIVGAELTSGALEMGTSSFVIVDFFDFESQVSSFIHGDNPRYDFATSYKLLIDDFLLSYLATESLRLELNQSRQLDYDLLAQAEVPLHGLLESRPSLVLPKQPLLSVRDNSVLGTLHIEVRLALPVAEVYSSFLRQHPEEKRRIERANARKLKVAGTAGKNLQDHLHLHNEIVVTVVQVSELPCRSGSKSAPFPYVHYQFMGFQDVFTPVAEQGTAATFAHSSTFTVSIDSKLLQFLKRYSIHFEVIDYSDDECNDGSKTDNSGLIGKVEVSLAALAAGNIAEDIYDLRDENGRAAGRLKVKVEWRYPLQLGRTNGPRALMSIELAELLAKFSVRTDGLVHYMAFLRYCDPPPPISEALTKIRDFLQAGLSRGLDTGAMLDHLKPLPGSTALGVSEEAFMEGMTSLHVPELTAAEIADVFQYLDTRQASHVPLDTISNILDPPSTLLKDVTCKIQHRLHELNEQGIVPLVAFEHVDVDQTRLITRLQFKETLVDLGFLLVDEPAIKKIEHRKEDASLSAQTEEEHGGEFLRPVANESWASFLGRGSRAASRAEHLREQRELFEQRIKKLEEAAVKAACHRSNKGAHEGADDKHLRTVSTAAPQSTCQDIFASAAVVKQSEDRISRYDSQDEAASFIQGTYRTYRMRRSSMMDTGGLDSFGTAAERGARVSGNPCGASISASALIEAEEALKNCLKSEGGMIREGFDLQPTFHALDLEMRGILNHRDFAHALRQHRELVGLDPQHMQTLGAFFDTSRDGTAVDYRAFLLFIEHKALEPHPAVSHIRKMILHSGSLEVFSAYDSSGLGLIRDRDFVTALQELGYGYLGREVLHSAPDLFDFREILTADGEETATGVDYENFLEYALEQEGSVALRKVEDKLRASIGGRQKSEAATDLRRACAAMDVLRTGAVSKQQFAQALRESGSPQLSDNEMTILLSRVDANSTGNVHYDDFVRFIQDPPSPRPLLSSIPDFDESSLQAKGSNLLVSLATRGMDVNGIGRAYTRYDWQHSGEISAGLFVRAAIQAGLTYSQRELLQLAKHFALEAPLGDGFRVKYLDFLAWLMADLAQYTAAAAIVRNARNPDLDNFQRKAWDDVVFTGLMAHLRDHQYRWVQNGIDYRNRLERYDGDLKGTITPASLQRALRGIDVDLSEEQMMQLTNRFSRQGRIDYLELLHALRPWQDGCWEVEEELRWMIRRRFQYYLPGSLREPFRHFSLGKRAYFTEHDFSEGLHDLGFKLPIREERVLFGKLDAKGVGKVSYPDFVTFVRDPNYADVEGKMVKRIRKLQLSFQQTQRELESQSEPSCAHRQYLGSHSDDNEDMDLVSQDNAPEIDLRDFVQVLTRLGLDLPGEDMNRIASRFLSPLDETKVAIDPYVRFVKDVQDTDLPHGELKVDSAGHESKSGKVDLVVRRLCELVETNVAKALPAARAFELFDRDATDSVRTHEFRSGLRRLGISTDTSTCQQVMQRLGAQYLHGQGLQLSCDCFLEGLRVAQEAVVDRGDGTKDWHQVKAELQAFLHVRPESLPNLQKYCQQADPLGKGVISRTSLYAAIVSIGTKLTPQQIGKLMDQFRAPGDEAQVDYHEMLVAIRSDWEPIIAKIGATLAKRPNSSRLLRDTLEGYDLRACKQITRREFRLSLIELNIKLSPAELRVLFDAFCSAQDESLVSYQPFLDVLFSTSSAATTDSTAAVLAKVRSGLHTQGKRLGTLRARLERLDEKARGHVSVQSFTRSLDELELNLTESDLDLLSRSFASDKEHRVQHMEFCDQLEAGEQSESTEDSAEESSMRHLMKLLTRALRRGADVFGCFERWDTFADGQIDPVDFGQGLRQLDIRVSRGQLREIGERFGGIRTGTIDYRSFVLALRRSDSEQPPAHGSRGVRRSLMKLLLKQWKSLEGAREVLLEADSQKSGKLGLPAFRRALQDMGLQLPQTEWQHLADCFQTAGYGSTGDGLVQYTHFLNWLDKIQKRRKDDSFGQSQDVNGSIQPASGPNMRAPINASIEVTIVELSIMEQAMLRAYRGAPLYVNCDFLGVAKHASGSRSLRNGVAELNCTQLYSVGEEHGEVRQALINILDTRRNDSRNRLLEFSVMSEQKDGRSSVLGTAKVQMATLKRGDLVNEGLRIYDAAGEKIGLLVVTVLGADVLNTLARNR